MTLYFAYGSNLNLDQMRRRCPDSRPVSRTVLYGYRLLFPRPDSLWRGGVAGIEPDQSAHVEGALYQLSDNDIRSLDRYEGIAEGDYTRENVWVVLPDGRSVAAFTYIAVPVAGGPFMPSARYLATIIEGARHHELSPDWVRFLEAHRPQVPPDAPEPLDPPATPDTPRTPGTSATPPAQCAPASRGFWATIGWTFLCILVAIGVQVAIGVIAVIAIVVQLPAGASSQRSELEAAVFEHVIPITVAAILAGALVISASVMLLAFWRSRDVIGYLGLGPFNRRHLLVSIGLLAVVILLQLLATRIIDIEVAEILTHLFKDPSWAPLLFVGIVITAPIYEELMFRGFMLRGLVDSGARPLTTILITSFAFTIVHTIQYGLVELSMIFVLGLLLGSVRYKTGSTTIAIMLHAIFNLVGFVELACMYY